MNPKELTSFQALSRSIQMVMRAAPRELRQLALLNLLTGTGPSVSLFLSKVVIDEASKVVEQGGTSTPIDWILGNPVLLWSVLGAIAINLLVDSIDSVGTALFASLRDRVQGYGQGAVLQKVAYFDDIALFETPNLLNLLELTEKGLQRLQRLSFIVAATMVGVFTFVPSLLVSISIGWWVPLVLLASSIPSIFVEMKHHKKSWRVEETQASITRRMNIYAKTITSEDYAKEVRLFSLQSILMNRWRDLFHQMFSTMEQVRKDGAFVVFAWALVGGLGITFPYVYVILGILRGDFTLGDLALYTGIILQMRRSLYILIAHTGDIYDVSLATSPIFQLLDLPPQLCSGTQKMVAADSVGDRHQGIRIDHVAFTYPGSESPTLRDVSLSVRPGEMIALVGENGAGKTTLAKLLCRLYDPTAGAISWHGQNLRTLDLTELRSRIGVVMQDYARFPATLRENVGWGYMPKLNEEVALQTVLQEAGIESLTQSLPQGLDTPLGKQLEDGMDLSGGQWQRVAIARALMRLSQVECLIFDEPTSALDPKNEQELYQIFRTIAKGRMAVVVSHRLALAKLADRIVVLEHGQVIEEGSHEQLMALKGQYHTMFTRQASSYL
ncbi:MAG: ABC transporter ATP-binding protein [Elainellaceae cyanobacterium]